MCRGRPTCLRLLMATPPPRWCGTRCGRLFMAAVRYHGYYQSPTASPGRAWPPSPAPGMTTDDVPHQPRQHRLARLPHLSRNAGRESADRRHLCLDGGRVQPGPGTVAGPVRGERGTHAPTRPSRSPGNGPRGLWKRTVGWVRRPSRTATTTWRWPPFHPSRTRC